ncbi:MULTISPECIES: hypothetical protein [Sphingobium]|uniref:hypothetical protein n=1 Tax=Sphingobium TaxID=165695 RepID=UPI0009172416|nr:MULTISPECIES: hypothetical protein [Sphingobium]SHM69173.1 hypothetical protein SAMN05518668_11920 [Sphingobium sp. YR657]
MIVNLALSLVLAVAGFDAIRRGTSRRHIVYRAAWCASGTALLVLALVPVAQLAATIVIAAMLWFFCILPLAGLIVVFGTPARR